MITKELLSNVLDKEIVNVADQLDEYNMLYWDEQNTDYLKCRLNVYELVHKCKEWAMSKGFIILTYIHEMAGAKREGESYYNVDVDYHSNKSKFGNLAFSDTAKEEPEAIFKGCQFILNQIKEQNND